MKNTLFAFTFIAFAILFACSKNEQKAEVVPQIQTGKPAVGVRTPTDVSESIFLKVEDDNGPSELIVRDEKMKENISRTIIYHEKASCGSLQKKVFYDYENDGQVDSIKIHYYQQPTWVTPGCRSYFVELETLAGNKNLQKEYNHFLALKYLIDFRIKEYMLGENRDSESRIYVQDFEEGYAITIDHNFWIVKYKQNDRFIVNPL